MEKIAVITVNYNGKKDTLELLESLGRLQVTSPSGARRLQTVVVDNGSVDGSVSEIKRQYPDIDVLQTGENLGFSGGYNKGLDYANIWGADYFLLINNDCLIKDPDFVLELIKTAKSDPKIGLVSPKILFAPGFEFHKERYAKKDLGNVVWYAGGRFDWDNIGSIHQGLDEVDSGQYDGIKETEIISGACVLIKKEVIDKIGLFDERYFLYFEDSDFVKRAQSSGFKNYYNGKATIYHKVSQSTGIGSVITDYYHTRNRLIFGMQYGKLRTKFALLREAVKLCLLGRPAQRQGVLDFYLGVTGGSPDDLRSHIGSLDRERSRTGGKTVEYPLKLSIGIVNYNTADLTKKLLESIFNKDSGFQTDNMEVIVLDNGLTDPCKDKIAEYLLDSPQGKPKIKYIANKENEGFSKGYNKTIRYSLGEYYLMFNSDIEVLKEGISELVQAEDEFAGEAVLGGKLLFPDMSKQDSAFHLPTISGALKEYFLKQKGAYFMFEPSLPGRSQNPPPRWIKVEGLMMACLLIPKKVLNKVGLLDESKFIFFEDIEYCKRLKQFGIPVYFVPLAKFIHHHGASTKKIGQEKAGRLLAESSQKYHGRIYYILLTLVLRLGQKFGRVKTPVSRWQLDK